MQLERFSFESRKTKTKGITLNIYNTRKQRNAPIRIRSKSAWNRRQPRENACDQVMIGFGLHVVSHWLKKWREFC